jgi:hypothetical protein
MKQYSQRDQSDASGCMQYIENLGGYVSSVRTLTRPLILPSVTIERAVRRRLGPGSPGVWSSLLASSPSRHIRRVRANKTAPGGVWGEQIPILLLGRQPTNRNMTNLNNASVLSVQKKKKKKNPPPVTQIPAVCSSRAAGKGPHGSESPARDADDRDIPVDCGWKTVALLTPLCRIQFLNKSL